MQQIGVVNLDREKAAKEIEEEIGVEKTTSATGLGIGSCSNTTAAHGEQNRVPTPHARTGGIIRHCRKWGIQPIGKRKDGRPELVWALRNLDD